MRIGKRLAWAIALSALVGCGGKVLEGPVGEGGTGGSGATGGFGGSGATGGWGGHTDGGAGGGYGGGGYGGGYGGYGGGYGGYGGYGGGYGGYGGSYGGAGGSASCAFNVGWPQCESCVFYKCGAECSSCSADWECNQVLQCFTKCGATDQNCLQSCIDAYPNATNLLEKLFGECMGNNCQAECSNPGGSGGGGYGGGYGGYGGGYGGYGGGGYGGSPMTCGYHSPYPQCDSCINYKCNWQCNNCMASFYCKDALQCMNSCGPDLACQQYCSNSFPNAQPMLDQLFDGCINSVCGYDCGYAGSGGYGGGYGGYGGGYGGYGGGPVCPLQTGLAQCDLCIGANCMSDCMGCANSPDCTSLIYCVFGCPDQPCADECMSKYPAGIDAAVQWLGQDQCTWTKCQTECGG